ncbi:MAG TPA: hypothetical protein VF209_04230 [Patescibacteria group bacterium]
MKQRFVLISLVGLSFLLMGLYFVLETLSQRQDIRPQAASCNQAPVNTQFRKYTGQDTPWVDGGSLQVKVGEAIDINCFAKNGSALLSGGRLTGKVVLNGRTTALQLPAAPEMRNFRITQGGTYTITCSNSNSCSNTDSFTVTAVMTPSPSPTVSPSPTPCTSYKISDLNKDCQTTIEDYNIFLQDFRTQNGI